MFGLVGTSAARRKMCLPCVPGVGLYREAYFQVEIWEPWVGWVTRPNVIPLLHELRVLGLTDGEKSFLNPTWMCCLAAVVRTSLKVDSPPHEVGGGTVSSAASMAAV
jgi:hypothetical protein